MKQFITGAGLIGCCTAKRLVDNGAKVILYDSNPPLDYIEEVIGKENVIVNVGDIRDLDKLTYLLKKEKPSCIIHTAAVLRNRVENDPLEGVSINVLGAATVAKAAGLARAKKVVLCSSLSVYDYDRKTNAPITEEFFLAPSSIYDATKLSAEYILLSFSKTFQFSAIILRLASVYGYGLFRGGAWLGKKMQEIVNNLSKYKKFTIREEDFGINEYVYVKDVAQAIEKACMLEDAESDIFNIGSGRLTSTQELVDMFKKVSGNLDIVFIKSESLYSMPSFLRRTHPFDISKAKRLLGYKPKFDIIGGLQDYLRILSKRKSLKF